MHWRCNIVIFVASSSITISSSHMVTTTLSSRCISVACFRMLNLVFMIWWHRVHDMMIYNWHTTLLHGLDPAFVGGTTTSTTKVKKSCDYTIVGRNKTNRIDAALFSYVSNLQFRRYNFYHFHCHIVTIRRQQQPQSFVCVSKSVETYIHTQISTNQRPYHTDL